MEVENKIDQKLRHGSVAVRCVANLCVPVKRYFAGRFFQYRQGTTMGTSAVWGNVAQDLELSIL